MKIEENPDPDPVIGTENLQIASTVPNQNKSEDGTNESMNTSNDQQARNDLLKRKRINKSVSAKRRKLHQKQRIAGVLMPKSGSKVLHDIFGNKISDFIVATKEGGGFICQLKVNNVRYEGLGASQINAEDAACEKVLRDLYISKIMKSSITVANKTDNSIDSITSKAMKNITIAPVNDSDNNDDDNHDEGEDNDDDDDDDDGEDDVDDNDLPLIDLACYALYKQLSDWEKQGYKVPDFQSHMNATDSSMTVPKKLPPNWKTMNPTELINMIKPESSYTYLGLGGIPPLQYHIFNLTVDEIHFMGAGLSKKAGRKSAAISACKQIFGVDFKVDEQH